MAPHRDTPLSAVPSWTKAQVARLGSKGIMTAEQLVGTAATPGGIPSLAAELDLSETEMRRLVNAARGALPPALAAELSRAADASQWGLGALPPDE
jgi:hypothetical protein